MTTQDKIDQKKREIAALEGEQQRCSHTWGEIKYEPRTTGGYETEDTMFPRPPYPKVWIDKKVHPRWSRTCTKCGKTEHTENTKSVTRAGSMPGTTATEEVPDFGDGR
jgi:hypothetical protein